MTEQQYHALSLFKMGCDTFDIARQMMITEAQAYLLLFQAREEHRKRSSVR